MDGIGGTIENQVFWGIKSGKIQITDVKSFGMYYDDMLKNVKSLYLSMNDLLIE